VEKIVFNERARNLQFIENLSKKINSQTLPDNLLREYAQFLLSLNRVSLRNIKSKKNGVKAIFILLLFLLLSHKQKAQCFSSPVISSCNPAGSIVLVNNDVVAAGQIKTLNGGASYNTLTMNGGTLIVCGTLTLNSITFNSGVFIVNPGGSVLITPGLATVFGANSIIFNFGNFTITGSIVTGQNNIIFNCSTNAVFNVAFNQLVIQGLNTYVINNGILTCSYFIVQPTNSPNVVCSGIGSAIITNIMINQYANAFTSPVGPSCINILQQIINPQPMTTTSNVEVCYIAANVSVISGPNFGSATVDNNCPSCAVLLPLTLISFNSFCSDGKVNLNWISENEKNTSRFEIEKSHNAVDFIKVGQIPAMQNTNFINSYNYEFQSDMSDKSLQYIRLKQFDNNNDFSYSPIITISCNSEIELELFPSYNTGNYVNIMCRRGLQLVDIFDAAGRLIKNTTFNNEKFSTIFFDETIADGVYIVVAKNSSGKSYYKKMIIN